MWKKIDFTLHKARLNQFWRTVANDIIDTILISGEIFLVDRCSTKDLRSVLVLDRRPSKNNVEPRCVTWHRRNCRLGHIQWRWGDEFNDAITGTIHLSNDSFSNLHTNVHSWNVSLAIRSKRSSSLTDTSTIGSITDNIRLDGTRSCDGLIDKKKHLKRNCTETSSGIDPRSKVFDHDRSDVQTR